MARVINLGGALAPQRERVDCAQCLYFYRKSKFPKPCRECRHYPFKKGNVKDNFVFTLVRLDAPPKRLA